MCLTQYIYNNHWAYNCSFNFSPWHTNSCKCWGHVCSGRNTIDYGFYATAAINCQWLSERSGTWRSLPIHCGNLGWRGRMRVTTAVVRFWAMAMLCLENSTIQHSATTSSLTSFPLSFHDTPWADVQWMAPQACNPGSTNCTWMAYRGVGWRQEEMCREGCIGTWRRTWRTGRLNGRISKTPSFAVTSSTHTTPVGLLDSTLASSFPVTHSTFTCLMLSRQQ